MPNLMDKALKILAHGQVKLLHPFGMKKKAKAL